MVVCALRKAFISPSTMCPFMALTNFGSIFTNQQVVSKTKYNTHNWYNRACGHCKRLHTTDTVLLLTYYYHY